MGPSGISPEEVRHLPCQKPPSTSKPSAQRSLLVDELTALDGFATIPIHVEDNFPEFLRNLSKEDQELLLAYCVLGKTQNQLGAIMATQTQCSTVIRMAMRKMVDVQRAERDRSFEAGGFAVPGIEHGTRGKQQTGTTDALLLALQSASEVISATVLRRSTRRDGGPVFMAEKPSHMLGARHWG